MNFAQNVKKICKEKKIKQKDLINNFNLCRNQLDIWNQRNTIPSGLVCYNIANYLGCRIEDLLNLPYLE